MIEPAPAGEAHSISFHGEVSVSKIVRCRPEVTNCVGLRLFSRSCSLTPCIRSADSTSNFTDGEGFNTYVVFLPDLPEDPEVRQRNCMQQKWLQLSLMVRRSGSEVNPMRERFSNTELTALRNDLLQGGLADSREAAELVQVFLMGRGYGVSPEAARDAVGRVEIAGCALPVLQKELENLALVM
jgi:hypothetical protein